MSKYFGATCYVKEMHLEQLKDITEIDKNSFKYFFEVRTLSNINGNGKREIDIYIDGEKKLIEVGNWRIVPVAEAPYNWTGNTIILKAYDSEDNLVTLSRDFDNKGISFMRELEWIMERIDALKELENAQHANAVTSVRDAKSDLTSSDFYHKYGISPSKLSSIYENLSNVREALKSTVISDTGKEHLRKEVLSLEKDINIIGVTIS